MTFPSQCFASVILSLSARLVPCLYDSARSSFFIEVNSVGQWASIFSAMTGDLQDEMPSGISMRGSGPRPTSYDYEQNCDFPQYAAPTILSELRIVPDVLRAKTTNRESARH